MHTRRKGQGGTQERRARLVNVTVQDVLKWANGKSEPDVSTLPLLANVLHYSIDSLLGYAAQQRKITDYEERYKTDGYYWGIRPSNMCYEIMKLRPPVKPLRLLDVACGEGKDAVFFARNGYHVTAFDAAYSGLEKAKRLPDQSGVAVNFFPAAVLYFRMEGEFDLLFSSGSLLYVPQTLRKEFLYNYQAYTCSCCLTALNVFVRKPFMKSPSDERKARYK